MGWLAHGAFGGPLLRIPAARTRDGRRLRVAVVASVLFHCALLTGGALMAAVGNLRGGGTVMAVEMVLDTRGFATGPRADRVYAPPAEVPARAPDTPALEEAPEESLPALDEDPAETPSEMAPPEPEPLPQEGPPPSPETPTGLAALDAPGTLALQPEPLSLDTLEASRGVDSGALPPEAPAEAALPPQPPAMAEPLETEVAPQHLPESVETQPVEADLPEPAVAEVPAPTAEAPLALEPPPPSVETPPALTPPAPEPAVEPSPPAAAADAPQLAALTAPELAPAVPEAPAAPPQLSPVVPPPPTLEAPDVADLPEPVEVAEAEPVPEVPEAPTSLDTLIAAITPASLETAQPPTPRGPEPPRSNEPDPEEPPTDLASAAPPALALPPDPPRPQVAPEPQSPPRPSEDDELAVGPVDWTAPFAPPQLDPRRVDPRTRARVQEAADAEISAVLSDIGCGDLGADAGEDGRLSVHGYVTSRQEQAEIRNRLLGIQDVRGVADEDVVVIAEALCQGLEVYGSGTAAVAPDPEPMDHLPEPLRLPPLFGMQQGARAEFVDGRYLEIHVETPDFPAHVAIDYFKPDGTVVHLLPSELNTEAYFPEPGQPITIAESEPGDISVPAGPSLGTGMVVTLSTSEPLFVSLDERPLEENADAYLRRLDALLREKEADPEFRAQYGYVFVDAVRDE